MKYLIIALALVSSTAFAQETCEVTKQDVNTPVPAELKDATIIIRTKDGKETTVKANEFKVVKRKQQFKVKEVKSAAVVASPCEPEIRIVEVEKEQRKNILMLGVSYDYTGLSTDVTSNPTYISAKTNSRKGPVFDLSYYRRQLLTERFGAGLGLNTNLAPRAFVGYEF